MTGGEAFDALADALAERVLARVTEALSAAERETYRRGYMAGHAAARRGSDPQPSGHRVGRPRKTDFVMAAPAPRQPWDSP